MPDLFYGNDLSAFQNDSVEAIIGRLDSSYDVRKIFPSDLNSSEGEIAGSSLRELHDVPVVWRRKRGFEKAENDLRRLDRQSFLIGPNVLPATNRVNGSADKSVGKRNFERFRVPHLPEYDALTAKDVHSAGNPLMEKPKDQSQGRGVRPIMPDENFVADPDRIYEPLVNHHDPNSPWVERRVVTFAGEHANAAFAAQNRTPSTSKVEENYLPLNISQGNCRYEDPEVFTERDAEIAVRAAKANGGGFVGVDMLYNRMTGQRAVIETNSTVDISGISRATEEDIESFGARLLEQEIEGEDIEGYMTENLEEYSTGDRDLELPNASPQPKASVNPGYSESQRARAT